MTATVSVTDRLQLEVYLIGAGNAPSKNLSVKLNRIEAQRLADALLEYSGAASKSFSRKPRVVVGAVEVNEAPPAAHSVVRVSTRSGVVRLKGR